MPKIVVLDGNDVPSPEDVAMLAAMYSRDPRSVLDHLVQVKQRGSAKFHEQFYVGYGHKSIGDCGSTTVFFEGVSMLAAKAVQDTPLYNGQEASTRYIDFSTQLILNPLATPGGKAVQDAWMALYADTIAALKPLLAERYPRQPDQKESVWTKAIAAKAFDIGRSLIPAGGTTNVAWHVNLRQAYDHSREMRNHPLPEIAGLGVGGIECLKEKYPSSFSHEAKLKDDKARENYKAEEHYIAKSMTRFAYFADTDAVDGFYADFGKLDLRAMEPLGDLLASRPPRTELHQRFRQYGVITFKFLLDFGSYRDLQRQRSAVQEMPLLSMRHGFHPWYIEQMPLGTEAQIAAIGKLVERLPADDFTRQYYVPMGFRCPVVMTCPLPSAVYIAELRSGNTVHPTLRVIAQKMGEVLKKTIPELAMHHDMSPDSWNVRRGTQDIVKKASA